MIVQVRTYKKKASSSFPIFAVWRVRPSELFRSSPNARASVSDQSDLNRNCVKKENSSIKFDFAQHKRSDEVSSFTRGASTLEVQSFIPCPQITKTDCICPFPRLYFQPLESNF